MFRISHSVLIAVLLCMQHETASAAPGTKWSMAAAGCSLDPAYEGNALVDLTTGTVTFSGSSTGYIVGVCPVSATFFAQFDPDFLWGTFTDTDGNGVDSCRAVIQFWEDAVGSTASVSTIAEINYSGGGSSTQYANSTTRQRHSTTLRTLRMLPRRSIGSASRWRETVRRATSR